MFSQPRSMITLLVFILFTSGHLMAQNLSQDSGRQIILKYKNTNASQAQKNAVLKRLSNAGGVTLNKNREMSGNATVFSLPDNVPMQALEAMTRRFSNDPDIEYAEPDYVSTPFVVPNDPYYTSSQWHYKDPATYPGAMNLPSAWDITKGDANMVIAVIDTGFRPHVDLEARRVAGYDFISNPTAANDGNGRDSDATDTGDACNGGSSSWHGTHVAGTIGAITNNSVGVSGVNWNSKIQHVRVLGACGGSSSDIADGIRWAAGISVAGVPDNATPAKVINMSLGGQYVCSSTDQSAINDAVAAGAVVVVAAGNSNSNASGFSPAGCSNVISVAAVGQAGQRASYSNFGTVVDVAAPGGSEGVLIWSTLNSGTSTPSTDIYKGYQGTSMAAPHVAGAVSLMLAVNPSMTPAQVETFLKSSTRAFPTGTVRDCNTSTCGAGLVDAYAAVAAASSNVFPTVNAGLDIVVDPSAFVLLSGAATDSDGSIVSYQWSQASGTAVTLTNANTSDVSFTAPATSGSMVFNVVATDNGGGAANDSVTVTVTGPPIASAGADISVLPGGQGTLNASASTTPTGTITSYEWVQTSGAGVTLSSNTSATPTFTMPSTSGAVLVFQLTVTNSSGFSDTDLVQVSFAAGGLLPVVTMYPDQSLPVNAMYAYVYAAGVTYYGNLGSLTINITQTSGPTVTLNPDGFDGIYFTTPATPATFLFETHVSDSNGTTVKETIVIVGGAPVARAGTDQVVNPGELVTLNGSASIDSGGSITGYAWTQLSGTTVTLTNANTATPTFTAPSTAGALSFQLTTTDNSTYTASDSVIVIVNPAPTANAGVDQVVSTNNTVSLTGAASTAAVGSTVSYAWSQTSGTAVTLTNGATKTPTFTAPSTAGTLVFDLTVTDTNGATATDSVIITVAGSLTVDVGLDQTVNPGATVNLNGAASGSAGNINSYAWTQTSGTTVTLNNATTTAANFTAPLAAGVLTFQMTASDDLLASGSDILNVTVNNIAPVLATISNVSINVGASVNFTISATDANGVAPTLEVSGLQTGIAFNAATGEFNWSNVPTAGTYTFTARAIDAQDSAIVDEQIFTITVASSGTLGFSVSTLTLNESDSATTITVNRTSGSAGIVTVNYAASNGTASSGSDFTAVSGTLTFADGVTSQTFTVSPIDDSIYEESETFTLNLSGATGYASITGGSIAVTINDNDTAVVGSLTLSASTYSVSENAGIKVITVNRVGGSDTAISVDYATSNGTALAGSDYTATSGTLSFAHGDTSKTFSITILDNSVYEGNEDLNITLSNPTTGVIINTSTAVLSIIENDAAIVGSLSLSASTYTVEIGRAHV